MYRKLIAAITLTLALICAFAVLTSADEADIEVTGSDGYSTAFMLDDDYRTVDYYRQDAYLTVTSDTPMDSLYIRWETEPGEWTLTVDGEDYTYGTHDFLHEYVELPKPSDELKITINKDRTYIADLYAFSGDTPSWVQKWEDPAERADMLFISTHSDDEILFLGGAIATYVNEEIYDIQVAYYCDFSLTESYRRHELLNGLWTVGVTHYPQLGKYEDVYSESLEEAKSQVDYDEVVGYFTETIRRFKPQVVVSQDFEGEYGHGQHRLVAAATADALEAAKDASMYTDSASEYGAWDVPKTYYHLYEDRPIKLEVRTPLSHFGGKTALEVAQDAYLEHQSQQWMWFHVSDGIDDAVPAPDGYSYSPITDFGLYRTLVGADTGNDMMENITPYALQEPAAPETEPESQDETADGEAESGGAGGNGQNNTEKKSGSVLLTILIIAGVILAVAIVLIIILYIMAANRKKKLEAERRRKKEEQRKNAAQRERSPGSAPAASSSRSRVKEIKDIK